MSKCLALILIAFIAAPSELVAGRALEKPGDPAIAMAKNAIMVNALNAASPTGRFACSKPSHACAGPNMAELALAVIEAKDGVEKENAAIGLLAVKLDGAAATTHTCLLLNAGPGIKRAIQRIDASKLRGVCLKDTADVIARARPLYEPRLATQVCLAIDEIEQRAKEVLDAIAAGRECLGE